MFLVKKIGRKYQCYGPGMKKLSTGFICRTRRQALAELQKHKEAYLRLHMPALAEAAPVEAEVPKTPLERAEELFEAIQDADHPLPVLASIVAAVKIAEHQETQDIPLEDTSDMPKKPTEFQGGLPPTMATIARKPSKEEALVRPKNKAKLKPGFTSAKSKGTPLPKPKAKK